MFYHFGYELDGRRLADELVEPTKPPAEPVYRSMESLSRESDERLRSLVFEMIRFTAPAVGRPEIGLEDRFAGLSVVQQFTRTYLEAGTFRSIHSVDAKPPRQEFDHAVWSGGPCAMPKRLQINDTAVDLGESVGDVTYGHPTDVESWSETSNAKGTHEFRTRALRAARQGHVVVSWVEFQP